MTDRGSNVISEIRMSLVKIADHAWQVKFTRRLRRREYRHGTNNQSEDTRGHYQSANCSSLAYV